ncbi:MAG: sulfite exporter TauE/SafE family protein [Pikeienuella sp.]
MTVEFFAWLALGAAAGGFINGLAGFGTALFALGFWLQIMPPVQAVAVTVVLSVMPGLQGAWVVRAAIMDQPRRLLRFLLPALIGVPLGVAALSVVEPRLLKLTLAGFLILYGCFFTLRSALPKLTRPTPFLDMVVGFCAGVLGGAASISGALPTMWCALRPWTKAQTRAVLQPFNMAVLSLTAVMLAVKGAYTLETLTFIVVALPVTMGCAQLGIMVFKRLGDDQFSRLLIGLMLLSGVILLARETLA